LLLRVAAVTRQSPRFSIVPGIAAGIAAGVAMGRRSVGRDNNALAAAGAHGYPLIAEPATPTDGATRNDKPAHANQANGRPPEHVERIAMIARSAHNSNESKGPILVLLLLFVAVHGLLLVHDIAHPEAFLTGDRAPGRLEKIHYLFHGHDDAYAYKHLEFAKGDLSPTDRFLENGDPGDYILHAAFYGIGGQYLVILVHLVLAFLAVLCVYRLAILLGQPQRYGLVAAIVYVLLPGSLMLPHQLVTEGIYNPLVVIAFYLIIGTVEEEFRRGVFIAALAILAVTIFVRFQMILYPILLAVIFGVAFRKRSLDKIVPIFLICFLGPLTWMTFVWIQTGSFSMGESNHSLSVNFFIRAQRIADAGGFAFAAADYPGREMTAWDFLSLVAQHPLAYLHTVVSNLANVLFNPGLNAFGGHYLRLFDTEYLTYWRENLDRHGVVYVVGQILGRDASFAVPMIVSAVVLGLIGLCSVFGAAAWIGDRRSSWTSKAILLSYLVYGILSVLVLGGTRWGHRTPVEFVIVILFTFGLERIFRRRVPDSKSPALKTP
jgi:hypothetical protein